MESIIKKIHNHSVPLHAAYICHSRLSGILLKAKKASGQARSTNLKIFRSPDFVRKIIFRYLSVPLTDDFKNIDIERALIDI
jgi:hypothetical protein